MTEIYQGLVQSSFEKKEVRFIRWILIHPNNFEGMLEGKTIKASIVGVL